MKAFIHYLDKIETTIVTITLTLMTIVIFIQVFFRTVGGLETFLTTHNIEFESLRHGARWLYGFSIEILSWTEELARYLMVWTVFIGAAIGAKLGAHVGIEAFIKLFPTKLVKLAFLISGLLSMIFCLFLTIYGFSLVTRIVDSGQISPAMEIPMGFMYAAIPIGGILMAGHFMSAGIVKYRTFQKEGK